MSEQLPRKFGGFLLLKLLGAGATADAHLARPLDSKSGLPSPIVVKRLHGQLADDEDFVRRFRHEAEVAVHVTSPHVARVYGAGRVGETLYMTMEYVAGWPLSRVFHMWKKAGLRPSVEAAVELICQVLVGLEALHSAVDVKTKTPLSIVHRDISPKNVMLGEDGRVRLIDLGLGKSAIQDWRTRTGVVMGTIGYMSPEQISAERVDLRSDLFVAAVLLYELLTLEYFIERGPFPIMLKASVMPELHSPSRVRKDVPQALEAVLARALDWDPARRFASATEMAAALRSAIGRRATQAELRLLADEVMRRELDQTRTQVTSLISKTWSGELEMARDDTTHAIVFAEHTALIPSDELRMSRGAPPAPSSEAMFESRAISAVRASRRFTNIAAMIGMLGAGIFIGRLLWTPSVEQAPVVVVHAPAPPAVDPPPQVVARPAIEAQPPAPRAAGEEEPAPALPRSTAPKRAARAAGHGPTAAPEKAPEDVRSLIARAKILRARIGDDADKAKAIDRIVSRLVLEASASDTEHSGARVSSLAAELDALEKP